MPSYKMIRPRKDERTGTLKAKKPGVVLFSYRRPRSLHERLAIIANAKRIKKKLARARARKQKKISW